MAFLPIIYEQNQSVINTAAEARLHSTLLHLQVASHLHQECTFCITVLIWLHLDQTEQQATEGCSFFSQFKSHYFTSNIVLFLVVRLIWISVAFFDHHMSSTWHCSSLWKSSNSGCIGLASLLNWHFPFRRKTFYNVRSFEGIFMFDHLKVCIGFIIYCS